MSKSKINLLPVVSGWLIITSGAIADEYHYRNILVGERAAGMGGAYTAVSDTPAGLFYNPAGIVYASTGNVSASVNAYHVSNKTYKRGLSGVSDWERVSSTFVPNFFGVMQPLGKGVIGFSYAVPDSIIEDQDLEFMDTASGINKFVVNFNNDDRTYNIGPSYAIELSKKFSIGASLYFHQREREWISNQLVILKTGAYQWSNTYFQTTEYGVKPMLGLMWSPIDKWAVGLNLAQTTVLSSDSNSQITVRPVTSNQTLTRTAMDSQEKRKHPVAATLGVAYFASKRLLVAADVNFNSEVSDATFGDKEATLNFATGVEYYLNSTWVARGGIFTNYANTPEVEQGSVNQPEHLDYIGGAASVTRFTRNSSITLGLNMSTGDGKAQIVGGSNEIQDVQAQTYTLFMSTSYNY